MLRSPILRLALGALLGGLAGASLCLSVLPLALQAAGYGSQLAIGVFLARLTPYAALVMAAGGWRVARTPHPLTAALVFSLVGATTALLLAGIGLGRETRLLAVAAGAGWLYGLVGGLILGRVLAAPGAEGKKAGVAPRDAVPDASGRDGSGERPAE